jgi:hypothetical protein
MTTISLVNAAAANSQMFCRSGNVYLVDANGNNPRNKAPQRDEKMAANFKLIL